MRTLKDAPTYYAYDPESQRVYVELAQTHYGFTPNVSLRQLIRATCNWRLETFVGRNITNPEFAIHANAAWDSNYRQSTDGNQRYAEVDMSIEWGGNWGFYAMTSVAANKRLIVKFMAEQPSARLTNIEYRLHPAIDGYYPQYQAVESVGISYTVE